MKKLQQTIIMLLLIIIVVLSLKINQLSQVDITNINHNINGTYTIEIKQGNDNYTYHFED